MPSQSFAEQVVGYSDRLRVYARRLSASSTFADDLVQETVVRALVHADQFSAGTNLAGWLHTILRNCYLNERRLQRRLISTDAMAEDDRTTGARQLWSIELQEIEKLVAALPATQREALALVAVEGNSYDEAARKTGCATGTMKSRVSRARSALLLAAQSGSRHSAKTTAHLNEAA